MSEIREIPIEKIQVGEYEQRLEVEDDGIGGLADSIARLGLVYPLVVNQRGNEFILVEGHRRLAACKKLGLSTVNVLVQDVGKEKAAEIAFAGNFFRKDLSPVELAGALKDCLVNEAMTVEQLAAGFHRSVHWVQRMIAICDWPSDVQEAIHGEEISVSAGSNLACVTEPGYRAFLVRNAVEQGATARTTAAWLQAWRANQPQEEAVTSEPVPLGQVSTPMIPQAPCFLCSQVFAVNEMSHLPICGGCIQTIRKAGMS